MLAQKVRLFKSLTVCLLIVSLVLIAPILTKNSIAQTELPFSTQPDTKTFGYSTIGAVSSSLKSPKTITLCNYTTPNDAGTITEINIYLNTTSAGSQIKAVIFANEPNANFPLGGEPIAESAQIITNSSDSAQWYNFTINYSAAQNTIYWIGYYSDTSTKYACDSNNDHLTITSQPKEDNSTWLPIGWSSEGKTIMTLYAVYTPIDPTILPTPTPTPLSTPTPNPTSTPTLTPNPTPKTTPTPTPTPELDANTPKPIMHNNMTTFGYATPGASSSDLKLPKTFTLCNYTTPNDVGTITEINIYLTDISAGSRIKAVIFANEPTANFPLGGEPIAESTDIIMDSSVSGQWYNFSINYTAMQNTVYWIGYYSSDSTNYLYDSNDAYLTVTSQPKEDSSSWLPVGWGYEGKKIMSLCAVYVPTDGQSSFSGNDSVDISTESLQDTLFVLLVICGESVIFIRDNNSKKRW